jgi:hypothetical protein
VDDAAERTAELMDQWLDSVVVWWDHAGDAAVLAGPDAAALPGDAEVVHVLTAQDPGGERQSPERNRALLGELLRWAAGEMGPPTQRWWPATGCSSDLDTFEQGVAVAGIDRRTAAALGRRFDQLAVYEATDDALRVITCRDAAVAQEVPRRWPAGALSVALPPEVLTRWWTTYQEVGREVGAVIGEAGFA